jgi:hypothetical protein
MRRISPMEEQFLQSARAFMDWCMEGECTVSVEASKKDRNNSASMAVGAYGYMYDTYMRLLNAGH